MTTTAPEFDGTTKSDHAEPNTTLAWAFATLAVAAFAIGAAGTTRGWTSEVFPDGWAIVLAVFVLPLGPVFASLAVSIRGLGRGRVQTTGQIVRRAALLGVFAFLIFPGLITMVVLPILAVVSFFS